MTNPVIGMLGVNGAAHAMLADRDQTSLRVREVGAAGTSSTTSLLVFSSFPYEFSAVQTYMPASSLPVTWIVSSLLIPSFVCVSVMSNFSDLATLLKSLNQVTVRGESPSATHSSLAESPFLAFVTWNFSANLAGTAKEISG